MKQIVLFLLSTFFVLNIFGQTNYRNVDKSGENQINDQMPIYKAKPCKKLTGQEAQACTNQKIIEFINKNLEYPAECLLNDIIGKVNVIFIVNAKGEVTNVRTNSNAHELLKAEAIRLVSELPDFIPGVENGKKVPVQYIIPINFSIATN